MVGDGGASLHRVPAEGGDDEDLADGLPSSSPVVVSPDGSQRAYVTKHGDHYELRVHASNTSRNLAPAAAPASADELTSLAWSPDGRRLAFNAQLGDEPIVSVHVVDAAGGSRPPPRLGPAVVDRELCVRDRCFPDTTGDAREVTWLGNDQLAYSSEVMGDRDHGKDLSRVFTLDLASPGARPTLLVEVEGPLDQLVASPDGRYLLYGLSTANAYVVDLRRHETRRLADAIATPAWSADGEQLVFVNNGQVMSARADGSHVANLTHIVHVSEGSAPPVTPVAACWSPDRHHIAFVGNSDEVYLMNADGTGWSKVADADGEIGSLTWIPAPG